VLDGLEVLEEGKKALGRIGALVNKCIEKFELGQEKEDCIKMGSSKSISLETSHNPINLKETSAKLVEKVKSHCAGKTIFRALWFFNRQKYLNNLRGVLKLNVIKMSDIDTVARSRSYNET
jgi:hypothetical protein